ncbi:hypothetical protein HY488_00190 [Candidatus Woesearchaeota archaeon]|nr:hypothetical protein [Candidatus Woesearchaeota archaeon]
MSDLQKNYLELQKKYALPSFEELHRSFELSSIDAAGNILREICKKMDSKFDEIINLLQGILQPETTIRDLHECRVFTEKNKTQAFSLYRKLMALRREASLLSLDSEEKKEAAYINASFVEWQGMKQQLQDIVIKIRDSWKKEISVKEELGYLG